MASSSAIRRLKREYQSLQKDAEPRIHASFTEKSCLEWHFVIDGSPDTPYVGGLYHGKLVFPPQFPMKPPSVLMLTPTGRFEVNKRICMSMSDFHPESWNPTWSVRTILVGLVSFMNGDELTTGGVRASVRDRVRLAKDSLNAVTSDSIVVELFPKVIELAQKRLSLRGWPPPAVDDNDVASIEDEEAMNETTAAMESTTIFEKLDVNEDTDTVANTTENTKAIAAATTVPPPLMMSTSQKKNAKKRAKAKAKKQGKNLPTVSSTQPEVNPPQPPSTDDQDDAWFT